MLTMLINSTTNGKLYNTLDGEYSTTMVNCVAVKMTVFITSCMKFNTSVDFPHLSVKLFIPNIIQMNLFIYITMYSRNIYRVQLVLDW